MIVTEKTLQKSCKTSEGRQRVSPPRSGGLFIFLFPVEVREAQKASGGGEGPVAPCGRVAAAGAPGLYLIITKQNSYRNFSRSI